MHPRKPSPGPALFVVPPGSAAASRKGQALVSSVNRAPELAAYSVPVFKPPHVLPRANQRTSGLPIGCGTRLWPGY
jgi:hypothetical protein